MSARSINKRAYGAEIFFLYWRTEKRTVFVAYNIFVM